ncbi:MAG: hypothetical protein AW09_002174 [Candidatus Accumulibacter phosphatis]|jgi:hypothetical protein|uniref:Uncharacterized protein n=1 Tax=Candidatus Accumulibacter phosphatis TaxID=327160 RepID=A0A080LVK2_9PROT|nr:MAG: hypothetical protein AW09_002174 [Candidatus Accumulibacter phosphatis]
MQCALREVLGRQLASLPPKDAEVLRTRFGLNDGDANKIGKLKSVIASAAIRPAGYRIPGITGSADVLPAASRCSWAFRPRHAPA